MIDSFNCKQENYKNLITSIKKFDGLNLFVGTGINGGLTDGWPALLDNLIKYILSSRFIQGKQKKSFYTVNRNIDYYEKALIIKKFLGKSEYILLIKDEIYKRHSLYEKKIDNSIIPKIYHLCNTGIIRSIISINYDYYLERFLKEKNVLISTIYGNKINDNIFNGGIPIFYIHGHINPFQNSNELFEQDITLSMNEYFNLFNNPLIWQNVMPIYNLMLYPSLFLGTSLDDINLYRLIDLSNRNKQGTNAFWYKSFNVKEIQVKEMKKMITELKGIHCIDCGTSDNHHQLVIKALEYLISEIKHLNKKEL